jgi:hypothetical protein
MTETPEEKLARSNVHELPKGRKARDGNGTGNGKGTTPRFPLIAFDDVVMSTTSFYLVKDIIPCEGLVVIYGPPKCGKSFWTFDLLVHLALGWDYRGLRVKNGHVVYCALEGQKGFTRRIEAFKRTYPESKGAPFHFTWTPLDLIKDHKALIASIRDQLPKGVAPSVVTIDTLNRSLVGSENAPEDMGAYVRAADAIREAFGCVVIVIHHCPHDASRPRGHSSLLGAADVLIFVTRDEAKNIVATIEHAKDGEEGLTIVSRLVACDLGFDDEKGPISSCTVEAVGERAIRTEAEAKPPKLSSSAKIALRALHETILDFGELNPSSHIPSGQRTVTVKQWRATAFRIGVSESDIPHSMSAAFKRAFEVLVANQKVGVWEPFVWPVFKQAGGE